MIQRLEHLSSQNRLRELGLFRRRTAAEKRRLRGNLIAAFQQLNGTDRKDEDNLFNRARCKRTSSNGFKLREGRFKLDKEEIFYYEGGETLEQVAQRGGRCPISGNVQGQVGQGSEHPGLVKDVPIHCTGVGLDDLQNSFQPKALYGSKIQCTIVTQLFVKLCQDHRQFRTVLPSNTTHYLFY